MIVPNITLKKMLTTRMIPVFLKPMSRYLSPRTFVKFSIVIRAAGGRSRGDVFTISAFVLKAANRVSTIGARTTSTIAIQTACFKIWIRVLLFIPFIPYPSLRPGHG